MLNRRDAMIRIGQLGCGSLALPQILAAKSANGSVAERGSAKSIILLYLWGGPPQQDMWDLKPDTPDSIRSVFKSIDTRVPGIRLCEHLPLLAQHTDKFAIVRSMSHDSNNHEPSVYYTLTGKKNPKLSVPRNQRGRRDAPHIAALVSSQTRPLARPAELHHSTTPHRP